MTPDLIIGTALYRFFGFYDELLYVGITDDLATRFEAHLQTADWWGTANHEATRIEWLPTWRAAEEAERLAIHDERPLWNRRGSPWVAVLGPDKRYHAVPKPKSPTRSRHAQRAGVMVRTEPDVRDAANAALEDRGWDLKQFIVAALKAIADQPDAVLRLLGPYRPEPRRRGRPPVNTE